MCEFNATALANMLFMRTIRCANTDSADYVVCDKSAPAWLLYGHYKDVRVVLAETNHGSRGGSVYYTFR
jgi:hypothetical protein